MWKKFICTGFDAKSVGLSIGSEIKATNALGETASGHVVSNIKMTNSCKIALKVDANEFDDAIRFTQCIVNNIGGCVLTLDPDSQHVINAIESKPIENIAAITKEETKEIEVFSEETVDEINNKSTVEIEVIDNVEEVENTVAKTVEEPIEVEILDTKEVTTILNLAVQQKIVIKAGSWYSYNEDTLGQGKKNVINLLCKNPTLLREIKAHTNIAPKEVKIDLIADDLYHEKENINVNLYEE